MDHYCSLKEPSRSSRFICGDQEFAFVLSPPLSTLIIQIISIVSRLARGLSGIRRRARKLLTDNYLGQGREVRLNTGVAETTLDDVSQRKQKKYDRQELSTIINHEPL